MVTRSLKRSDPALWDNLMLFDYIPATYVKWDTTLDCHAVAVNFNHYKIITRIAELCKIDINTKENMSAKMFNEDLTHIVFVPKEVLSDVKKL